jgi:hypothetical protein
MELFSSDSKVTNPVQFSFLLQMLLVGIAGSDPLTFRKSRRGLSTIALSVSASSTDPSVFFM